MLARLQLRKWPILLGLALATPAICAPSGASPVFPDRQRRAVVDEAHVLTDAQNQALSARILAYVRATHHQLVIATVPTLQGVDVKDYGYRLLRAWGLGDSKRNDGVILLLSTNPRKVRIEVGYGLEPELTDALTSDILQTRVVPRLKAGDVAGGLDAGAHAIMAATGGTEVASSSAQSMARQRQVALIGPDGSIRKLTPEEAHTLRRVGIVFGFAFLFMLLFYLFCLFLARRRVSNADVTGGDRSGGYSSTIDPPSSSSSSSDSGFSSGGGSAGGGGSDSSW